MCCKIGKNFLKLLKIYGYVLVLDSDGGDVGGDCGGGVEMKVLDMEGANGATVSVDSAGG